MEQQLAASLGEGQIAELIEHNEVPPGEIFGDPSLAAAPRSRCQGLRSTAIIALAILPRGALHSPCAVHPI
jgi:hypothetical protein